VADVEGCVGVGQGGGDEQLACHGREWKVDLKKGHFTSGSP
jgi:hypothetical protein